jgi:hypothetical protein
VETDPYVAAGPEDEFEPDWGAGPGTAGLEFPPGTRRNPRTVAPWSSGSGRMHGARLGMDIGGKCGFRPAAEGRVAMMTGSLGDTSVHIISRVNGSGTERRLRDFGGVLGIRGADRVSRGLRPLWPCPPWHAWRGPGVQTPLPRPLFGRGVPHGHQHPDTRVGRCFRRSLPCAPVAGSPNPVGHHRTESSQSQTWGR